MRRVFDTETVEAMARLLAQSDPTDLPRRAHVLRCPGDPNRRVTRLQPIFMAWLQWRCLAVDGEAPTAPAASRVELARAGGGAATPRRRQPQWHGRAPSPPSAAVPWGALSMGASSIEVLA